MLEFGLPRITADPRAVHTYKVPALAISFFLIEKTCFSQIDSTQQTPVIDSAEIKYDSAKNLTLSPASKNLG
jgi:hypothetical protein